MAVQRSKRKWLFILTLPVVIIVVFIAFLPALVSAGLGHGRILAAIQPHINGRVDFASLKVRWLGPQELSGLRIRDADDKEVAKLDLNTNLSLLGFIFGRQESIELNIAGTVDGTFHEDGTTSFQKLVKAEPDPRKPKPSEPTVIELAGLPELRINLDLQHVNLHDDATGRTLVLRDAAGAFHYEPSGRVSVQFESATDTEGLAGNIRLSAVGEQLLDARGRFSPAQASATFDLEAVSLPILGLEESGELQRLTLGAKSAKLTDRFVIELDADAKIEGMEPSKLVGAITLASLFRDDGTLDFRMENVSGMLAGERVPSSIVQPFLAATPIVLMRDAGPTVDVNVDFVVDEVEDPPGRVMIAAARALGSRYGARLEVDATFNLDSGQWHGKRLIIASDRAHPDLVEGYTGLLLDGPTDVVIELTSFTLPPIDEAKQKRPMQEYAATGSITANGPLVVALETETHGRRTIHAEQAHVAIDSARLADGITVRGAANVEGGRIEFQQHITHLFDDAGEIDAFAAKPVGTISLRDVPSRLLIEWMPEHVELLTEALGESVHANVTTRIVDDELEARLTAQVASAFADATIRHQRDIIRITEAKADVTVSPKLAAIAQGGGREPEQPLTLLEPIAMAITIEPISLRLDEDHMPNLGDALNGPVRAGISVPHAAIDGIAALAEPVVLRDIQVNLGLLMSETWTYDASLAGAIHQHAGNQGRIARIGGDMHIEPGEVMAYRAEIALTSIHTRRLESLLGRDRDSLGEWIGTGGNLTATVNGRGTNATGTLASTMPRLIGRFDMSLDDDHFSLTTDRADLSVNAKVAERIINRQARDGEQQPATIAHVEDDLPLQLQVRTLHVPATLLMGGNDADSGQPTANGLADIAIDMHLTGGPAKLRHEQHTHVSINDIRLNLNAEALRNGIAFDLAARADHNATPGTTGNPTTPGTPGSADAPGTIAVNGTIRDLFDAAGELDFAHAQLNVDAQATRTPTMLLDALLSMNGFLHAAVGPEVNATLITRDFSTNTGTVDLDITTGNGFLRAKGNARDGLLHIASDNPIRAQLDLNPLLRQMLLARLHPILGDVVSADQPLRATLGGATLPMTGDVSSLNGDVEVNIGSVQFDRRSEMLMMLALARVADSPRLDGSVDPIRARIRNGVIEYDQFNVNIAQLSLPQSGTIDLNTGRVALRTNTMLGALATAFIPRQATEALGGRFGNVIREINVPIVYAGTLGEPGGLKPRIDPEFKLEERIGRIIAEMLLQDAVPLIPKLPIPNIGGALEDLFRNNPRNNQPKP